MMKFILVVTLACAPLVQSNWVADEGTCTSSATDRSALIQKKVTVKVGSDNDGTEFQDPVCKTTEGLIVNNAVECKALGCQWYRDSLTGLCLSKIDRMYIAGTRSTYSHDGKGSEIYRPEYMTTLKYQDGEWTSCSGRQDCWYGTLNLAGGTGLIAQMSFVKGRINKGSTVEKIMFKVPFECDGATQIRVRSTCYNHDIAELSVKYNGVEQDLVLCGLLDGAYTWKDTFIDIDPNQKEQALQVEMKAIGNPRLRNHVRHVQIMIPNINVAYDGCMQNTQCLESLIDTETGGSCELRTNNQLKWDCLNAETLAARWTIDCCARWRACLDDDTTASLTKKLKGVYGDASLVQADAKRHGDSKSDSCTCDASPSCQNPGTYDVTKTECEECWDWTKTATDAEIEDFIRDEPSVCCWWKSEHMGLSCTPRDTSSIQDLLSLRTQVKNSEVEHVTKAQ
jgi:hypothetical protein